MLCLLLFSERGSTTAEWPMSCRKKYFVAAVATHYRFNWFSECAQFPYTNGSRFGVARKRVVAGDSAGTLPSRGGRFGEAMKTVDSQHQVSVIPDDGTPERSSHPGPADQ